MNIFKRLFSMFNKRKNPDLLSESEITSAMMGDGFTPGHLFVPENGEHYEILYTLEGVEMMFRTQFWYGPPCRVINLEDGMELPDKYLDAKVKAWRKIDRHEHPNPRAIK
jgi:hypothetical protein